MKSLYVRVCVCVRVSLNIGGSTFRRVSITRCMCRRQYTRRRGSMKEGIVHVRVLVVEPHAKLSVGAHGTRPGISR